MIATTGGMSAEAGSATVGSATWGSAPARSFSDSTMASTLPSGPGPFRACPRLFGPTETCVTPGSKCLQLFNKVRSLARTPEPPGSLVPQIPGEPNTMADVNIDTLTETLRDAEIGRAHV